MNSCLASHVPRQSFILSHSEDKLIPGICLKAPKTTAQIIKYTGLQLEVSRFPLEPKGDWVLRFQMGECDTVCAQSNDNTTARVA